MSVQVLTRPIVGSKEWLDSLGKGYPKQDERPGYVIMAQQGTSLQQIARHYRWSEEKAIMMLRHHGVTARSEEKA